MDRTASHRLLVATASQLARKVFASLPFKVKLAAIYLKLAFDNGQTFGRYVYALAVYHGVKDMPPLKGSGAPEGPKPGEDAKKFIDRFVRVQKSYGADFGRQIYKLVMSKTHNEDKANDILSDLIEDMADGGSSLASYFKEGMSLGQIESALKRSAAHAFVDEWRKTKRRKTDQFKVDDEGAEVELPSQPADVEKMDLSPEDERRLEQFIEQNGNKLGKPDLDTYFELLRDGFDSNDIYQWRLLPSMQRNLPEDLRLDPTSPRPFGSKKEEMEFRKKLEEYPNPFGTLVNFNKSYITPLRRVIKEFIEDAD